MLCALLVGAWAVQYLCAGAIEAPHYEDLIWLYSQKRSSEFRYQIVVAVELRSSKGNHENDLGKPKFPVQWEHQLSCVFILWMHRRSAFSGQQMTKTEITDSHEISGQLGICIRWSYQAIESWCATSLQSVRCGSAGAFPTSRGLTDLPRPNASRLNFPKLQHLNRNLTL